jgi:murein DD-endopeptidase MepM/ murein hydrolase activator NlpD
MVIIETNQTLLPKVIIDKFDIKPGESIYSLYAHMGQSPEVGLGETVYCGQELGTVGLTGYDIVNPHLHLEIRIGPSDTKFTGMAFYDTSASIDEMDNYKRWRTSGDFRPIDPMLFFGEYISYINPGSQSPTP